MTGFGRGEVVEGDITASVEVRSVNGRYLEVSTRLPRSLSVREKDIKDAVRVHMSRGSVNVNVKLEQEKDGAAKLRVNPTAAKAVHKLLNDLRKVVKSRETIRLEHLLHFSEILETPEEEDADEKAWTATASALRTAMETLTEMRKREGSELAKELKGRVDGMARSLDTIEQLSAQRIPEERDRLKQKIAQLVEDPRIIDQNRLELEIAILAEKLDVTEECVRFRSHVKVFHESLDGKDAAGRKLNFLVQEMNREVNTIGSKTNDAAIAHLVVGMKEELEKVREQIQNIE